MKVESRKELRQGVIILHMIILLTIAVPIPISEAEGKEIKFYYHSTYGGYNSSIYHIRLNTHTINNVAYYKWNESYCADPELDIYSDRLYLGYIQCPPDNEEWRSVNYIITWFHKVGNYTDGVTEPAYINALRTPEEARAVGQAIWYFVNGLNPSGETKDRALEIIDEAIGKDVIREKDRVLMNISRINSEGIYHNVTLTASVMDGNGFGREGVKLIITIMKEANFFESPGTIIYEIVGWTDHRGEYNFTVINPNLRGNTTIWVTTIGRQVNILDSVTDFQHYGTYQPLVTLYNHTYVNHEVEGIIEGHWKLGFRFFVIPEFPLGTILPTISCLVALTILCRKKRDRLHTKHTYS